MDFGHVFSPIQIKRLTLKNRLVMPAMRTSMCRDDSSLAPQLLHYLVARARGGVGLIIQESTAVLHNGQSGENLPGMWDDAFIPGWRTLTDAVHDNGGRIAVQLHHAGRQTRAEVIGQQSVAPSAINCAAYPEMPRPLTRDEIVGIEDGFAAAAVRAVRSGYDAIEIHAAHGYLIMQFLSPSTNRREDDYGRDGEGRLRFALNVVTKMRRAVGADFPLLVRVSAEEYVPAGLTLADTLGIVPRLIAAGADVIHVSTGRPSSLEHQMIGMMGSPYGNLVHYSEAVKRISTVPVIAVGRIVEVAMAEDIVRSGKADMVAMGRALVADPDLPNKALQGHLDDICPCIGCHQGCRLHPTRCLENFEVGREAEQGLTPAIRAKTVVVVGGGPGGLEAARVAALRGHRVTLFDQGPELGGKLRIGSVPPAKQELGKFLDYLERQVRKTGVEVRLGETATAESVRAMGADEVVIATGGTPIVPNRQDVRQRHVVLAEDMLRRKVAVGDAVIVMGGGTTGCEVADYLAALGKQVTIVTRIGRVAEMAAEVPVYVRAGLMARLCGQGVQILTSTAIEEIREHAVLVKHGGERRELPADTVVLAQGYRPNSELTKELEALGVPVHVIGDAVKCRTALEAVWEGSETGRRI